MAAKRLGVYILSTFIQAVMLKTVMGNNKELPRITLDNIPSHRHGSGEPAQGINYSTNLDAGLSHNLMTQLTSALKDPGGVFLSGAMNKHTSDECSKAIEFIAEAPMTTVGKRKYLDSFGKLRAGILKGHTTSLGMYDECINVSIPMPAQQDSQSSIFTTTYCSVSISFSLPNSVKFSDLGEAKYTLGVCAPKQCNSADINNIYSSVLPHVNVTTACLDQSKYLPSGSMSALIIVLVLIGICVTATLLEGSLQLYERLICDGDHGSEDEMIPLLTANGRHICGHHNHKPDTSGFFRRTLLAFSFYTNTKLILSTVTSPYTITCLNGMRFISMTWVIIGHTALLYCVPLTGNMRWVGDTLGVQFASQVLLNGTVSVDTFFLMSGILSAYTLLRHYEKMQPDVKQFFQSLPLGYLHRYLRLTPAYGFSILIWSTLIWYAWDGPFFIKHQSGTFDPYCKNNWWTNLLYMNNIIYDTKSCAGWGWYLADDFQFSLVAPLFVYLFYKSSRVGIIAIALSILGSCVSAAIVSFYQRSDFTASISHSHVNYTGVHLSQSQAETDLNEFSVPWTRYQTYGVGLLTGCMLFTLKRKNYHIPAIMNISGWGLAATICLSVVYGPYAADMGYHIVYLGESVIYNALARCGWAVALAYVIMSCALGQGGWVNEFLSWRGFVPLSRLSYCAYLVNIPLIFLMQHGARSYAIYTFPKEAMELVLFTTLSFLIAFPFSLVFELPYSHLNNMIIRSRSGRPVETKPEKESLPSQNQSDYNQQETDSDLRIKFDGDGSNDSEGYSITSEEV